MKSNIFLHVSSNPFCRISKHISRKICFRNLKFAFVKLLICMSFTESFEKVFELFWSKKNISFGAKFLSALDVVWEIFCAICYENNVLFFKWIFNMSLKNYNK